jgi:hypothetical protein
MTSRESVGIHMGDDPRLRFKRPVHMWCWICAKLDRQKWVRADELQEHQAGHFTERSRSEH